MTSTIQVVITHINDLTLQLGVVTEFLQSGPDNTSMDISPRYDVGGALAAIAVSSLTHAILLCVSSESKRSNQRPPSQSTSPPTCPRFSIPEVCPTDGCSSDISLDLWISHGIDMLSTARGNRYSRQAVDNALGGDMAICVDKVDAFFFNQELSNQQRTILKAWALCKAASSENVLARLRCVAEISTC